MSLPNSKPALYASSRVSSGGSAAGFSALDALSGSTTARHGSARYACRIGRGYAMMPTVRIAVKVGIIAASSMAVAIHPILGAGGRRKSGRAGALTRKEFLKV